MFHYFGKFWEWLLLATTLLCLGLFLLGHDWFGINGVVAAVLALVAGLLGAVLSFLAATLIIPLVGLITAVIGSLVALVTTLLAFAVGGIFTPLAGIVVGAIYPLLGWLATTWLGTLLMPLYSTAAPLILKIAPWLTTSKFAVKLYDWLDDQPWWPQALVLTPKMQPKPKPKLKPEPKPKSKPKAKRGA